MAFEFKLPDLGEGIHEAQVLAWKVTPGQQVAAFQPLCEVESAKAAVELTAPVAGRIVETRFSEGAVAQLGDVLVVIDTRGRGTTRDDTTRDDTTRHDTTRHDTSGHATTPHDTTSDDTTGDDTARHDITRVDSAAPAAPEEWFGIVGSPPRGRTGASEGQQRVLAAPFVRKLARQKGVRLEDVSGSGPQGRVRIADVEAVSEARSADAQMNISIPLKGLRKSIAEHMLQAWRNAPQVTSMDLFDVTALVAARETLLGSAQSEGARLTYVPFFVKAAVEALKAVPEANAIVDEQQSAITLRSEYHIGVATAIPGGLVVPVVKHADRMSLLEIASHLDRLVSAARERRSTPADLSGSTFTITSFGGLPGSPLFATPIINYPEVAILGLGRIDLQPRVVGDQVVARHCIGVSFTFDHRVLDGEGAGRFMAALKRYIEQPLELLLRLR